MTVPPMNPPDDQSGGIPQPPQPPSPPQMPPMPPMQGSPQKNDTALYALIAGILSFVLCGIFAGIPAILVVRRKLKPWVAKVLARLKPDSFWVLSTLYSQLLLVSSLW